MDPVRNPYTPNAGSLSQACQRLLKNELIYASNDYGYLDIAIPRPVEFMRLHVPTVHPSKSAGRPSRDAAASCALATFSA